MKRIKKRLLLLLTLIMLCLAPISVFATDDLDGTTVGEQTNGNITDPDYDAKASQESTEDMLSEMFSDGLYNNKKAMQAGLAMSQPFVYIIFVFCIFIIVVVSYFFVGVTMTDLAFIIVPPVRGFLQRRTEKNGTSGSTGNTHNFCCVSDSCLEAVYGSAGGPYGGGGMGSGGMSGGGSSDRGVGSCLSRYVTSRTKEFIVFVLFVVFFLSGMLGRLVIVLFRLFINLFSGLANLA